MNSDYNIQYNDRGKLIYFEVNMKELFNVTLSSPGVISALNYSFRISKSVVPIKTGLMLKSYTIKKISSNTVRCFFDPEKIIGKKRLGKVVKEYYPQYLVDTPKRHDWLQILIKTFYKALKLEIDKLSKKNSDINMEGFYRFLVLLEEDQETRKKEETKRRRRLEIKNQKRRRDAFKKSLETGGK